MKKSIILGVFALTALTFGACTKSKDGAPGPAGKDGNANVSASNLTVASSDWQADGNGGWQKGFTANGFNPTLGAVEVFYSIDNTDWYAIPLIFPSYEMLYSFNSNSLTIDLAQTGSTSVNQPVSTCYFKIVVIPSRAMQAHPTVDLKNYNAVKNAFNLKD